MSIGFTSDAVNLTLEEKQRFSLVMSASMRGHEINFVHHKSGMLDEESYNGFIQNMTVFTNSPLFNEWWETGVNVYRKDFVEKVEEILKTEKGIVYDPFIDQKTQ